MVNLITNDETIEEFVYTTLYNLGIFDEGFDLNIEMRSKIDKHETQGLCFGDEDDIDVQISRTMHGERLKWEELLSNLAHELVHVKQHVTGELDRNHLWYGKCYKSVDYMDKPWEVEAYSKEKALVDMYLKMKGLK